MNWLNMPCRAPLEDVFGGLAGFVSSTIPLQRCFRRSVGTNRSAGRPTLRGFGSHRETPRPDGAKDDVRNRYNGVTLAGTGTERPELPFDPSDLQGTI